MNVPFHTDFWAEYTARAPLALAFERTLECSILTEQQFNRPVLDIGCGDGLFAKTLFNEPLDTGIDPDPSELREAHKTGSYRELLCCKGGTVPKPDGAFETILSNSVLEHIPDVTPVLKEAFRLLAPGGVFYFTVPTDTFEVWTVINQLISRAGLRNVSLSYRKLFNKFWNHFHAYTPSHWASLAVEAGFEVRELSRYNAPCVALTNDALVPFALPAMLLKRFCRRWVLSPAFRRLALRPFAKALKARLEPARHPSGCLVFVKAVKPKTLTKS